MRANGSARDRRRGVRYARAVVYRKFCIVIIPHGSQDAAGLFPNPMVMNKAEALVFLDAASNPRPTGLKRGTVLVRFDCSSANRHP